MFKGNKVYIVNKNGIRKRFFGFIPGLNIHFKGKNSVVEIYEPIPRFSECKIKVKDSCFISIQTSQYKIKRLDIYGVSNQEFKVGKNFSCNGCKLTSDSELNLQILIGEDCMFANNIILRTADSHSIYDKDTNDILNLGKNIVIGNHVWLTGNVTVLKGVTINENCVIGHGSIVTKNCDANSVYAGCPAKKIKTNISWDRKSPDKH